MAQTTCISTDTRSTVPKFFKVFPSNSIIKDFTILQGKIRHITKSVRFFFPSTEIRFFFRKNSPSSIIRNILSCNDINSVVPISFLISTLSFAHNFSCFLFHHGNAIKSDGSYRLWPCRLFLYFQHLIASFKDFPGKNIPALLWDNKSSEKYYYPVACLK